MNCKLLFTLAMSMVLLVGCEDSEPEVAESKSEAGGLKLSRLHQRCMLPEASMSQVQEYLRLGGDVNKEGFDGSTLLEVHVKNGSPEMISVLIEEGADVNGRNVDAIPLVLAAGDNPNPEVISMLIKKGADVNSKTRSGSTPLMFAAQYNQNLEVISVLLDAGANVKVPDESGNTPPMMSSKTQHQPRSALGDARSRC